MDNSTKKLDTKVLLSTLWIVVTLNILMADVLSLYIPGSLDELVEFAGDTPISQFMLVGAILNELVIVMIVLSRVLSYKTNRWTNIIVGIFTIAYIWGAGVSYPHYKFIAIVETVCLLVIIWRAWKWAEASQ